MRGKSNSPLSRSERIERFFELADQGYRNAEICREMGISKDTARSYREKWEERVEQRKLEVPNLLRDVLGNTIRQLEELDRIRKAAWSEYERASEPFEIACEECEHTMTVTVASATARNNALNTALKAQDSKAKVLGVIGVKQDFIMHVVRVENAMKRLLSFMANELCERDRLILDEYMSGLPDIFGDDESMAIEATSSVA